MNLFFLTLVSIDELKLFWLVKKHISIWYKNTHKIYLSQNIYILFLGKGEVTRNGCIFVRSVVQKDIPVEAHLLGTVFLTAILLTRAIPEKLLLVMMQMIEYVRPGSGWVTQGQAGWHRVRLGDTGSGWVTLGQAGWHWVRLGDTGSATRGGYYMGWTQS